MLLAIDKSQFEAIRIITGAMHCTDKSLLEAEAQLMPLRFRRAYLGLTFLGRTARVENNITANTLKNYYILQWMKDSNKTLSWIARAKQIFNTMHVKFNEIAKIKSNYLYYIPKLNIKYSMHTKKKSELTLEEVLQNFLEMLSKYQDFQHIYTDGSSKEEKTGCAVVTRDLVLKYRLPNYTNIFIAELYAIKKAIETTQVTNINKFLICCDSLSVLQALEYGSPHHLVHEIYYKLKNYDKEIVFEWIPSHVNLPGNNEADEMAKEALDLDSIEPLPLDFIDLKSNTRTFIKNCWQKHWEETNTPSAKFLYEIKPDLVELKSSNQGTRPEEIKLARLRLGTCLMNRKHHFKNEPHPLCNICQTRMTIKHAIIDCPQFSNHRRAIVGYLRHKNRPQTLQSVLRDDFPHALLFKFLKDTNLFNEI